MDLLREFADNGHLITIISPLEKKYKKATYVEKKDKMTLIKARTGNLFNVGLIEKGISQLLLGKHYNKALKAYSQDRYDLILYSTPPITLESVIRKQKTNSKTYLLLKDIFPQNAVDIGVLKKNGVKGILYRYYRHKEKRLYALSDKIGCMSEANVNYLLDNNPEIEPERVEICPNSVKPIDLSVNEEVRKNLRKKYGLPMDKKIFVYGGNLGKPQNVPFIIKCIEASADINQAHFLVAGDGTDYARIAEYAATHATSNLTLLQKLPKEEYDKLVAACDVGLIFLDYRFTIPNFPSRILSYMQAKLPVYAITDASSDVGMVIQKGNFGWYSLGNSEKEFVQKIRDIVEENYTEKKENAWKYLCENYDVKQSYEIIMHSMKGME